MPLATCLMKPLATVPLSWLLVNYVLDGDALFSWPCDGSFESNKLFAVEMKLLHPWSVVM